jgi:hypothetical protein
MAERLLRNRIVYAGLAVIAAGLGVHVHRYGDVLPEVIAVFAPQILWPMALFAGLGLVFRSAATWKIACGAYLISAAFEFSEFYHEPWIETIQGTSLGTLALGTGFLSTDLACYAMGVLLSYLLEIWTLH